MKTLICNFTGLKIYPGHGIRFIRGDSKTFNFINNKAQQFFLKKKNPRKVRWTQVYRRVNKKGIVEEEKRRRTRRTTKMQRAVVGASLAAIRAKRNQTAEVRQAQRDAAMRQIKERKKAAATKSKKANQGKQRGGAQAKNQKGGKNPGRVGGNR